MRYILMGIGAMFLWSCSHKSNPTAGLIVYNDSINQQFWTADFSADDKYIAVGGVDSILRIYHSANLTLYRSYPLSNWIHSVKWNPKQNLLAVATLSHYVQLIDLTTNAITRLDDSIGPTRSPRGNGSRAIGWNHTGDMLAVGGLDGILKIWDRQGNLLKHIDKYKPETPFVSYLALDWHPFKNELLAANFEIQLFDSAFNEVKIMEHVNKGAIILCADWHPSGDFFVIGDYGHNWEGENIPSLLHFWSYSGQLIRSVRGSNREYRNIDWNTSGSRLATASDKLRLWTHAGELVDEGPVDASNYLWGVGWNKEGTRIVTASRHKTIALWDSTATLLKRIEVIKE